MTSKKMLFSFCQKYVAERLDRIHQNIDGIQESLTSETKSSAGDKHETGRAMLQLEREKLGNQLAETEKMNEVLAKVDLQRGSTTIGLGNLVRTSQNTYFLAISAGVFIVGDTKVYCISIGTPIARLLLGKSIGDVVVFNGDGIDIQEIS